MRLVIILKGNVDHRVTSLRLMHLEIKPKVIKSLHVNTQIEYDQHRTVQAHWHIIGTVQLEAFDVE